MNTKPTKADRELSAALGIQASVVQLARESTLVEGEHWRRKSGRNAIEFTQSGKDAMAQLIDITPIQPPAAPVLGDPVNLSVIRPCRNPMFCTIKTPEGLAQDIRIRRNAKVRGGMFLQCAHDGEKWQCVHQGFKPL